MGVVLMSSKMYSLKEAILSYKPFKRKHGDLYSQYFKAKTGPFKDLVECDYFSHEFESDPSKGIFSTSIDLYASDIFEEDYVLK